MKRYILAVVLFSILGSMTAVQFDTVPAPKAQPAANLCAYPGLDQAVPCGIKFGPTGSQYHHASAVLTTPNATGELQPALNTAQLTVQPVQLQPTTTSQQLQPTVSSAFLQPAASGDVLSTATTVSVR